MPVRQWEFPSQENGLAQLSIWGFTQFISIRVTDGPTFPSNRDGKEGAPVLLGGKQ